MGNERKRKRQPQLDMTVAAIQGRYGPWAVARGESSRIAGSAAATASIPTGFALLDRALGLGGLPKGGICELVGPATSGKTTLALKILAQAQRGDREMGGSETRPYRVGGAQAKRGGRGMGRSETRPYRVGGAQGENLVGYIDQALYFDADYAYRCGVDLSRLLTGAPQDLAEALAMVESLVCSGSLAALVLDTLDFLWDDPGAAHSLAATLNRLRAPLAHSGTILLVLHDSPDTQSPALSALGHSSNVRLQVVRERWIRLHGDIQGYEARVEVLKNRLGPAGQVVRLEIEFNGTVQGNGL